MIGLITITLGTKQTGKRGAGKPHAAFDVAGAGNVTMVAGLRSIAKAMELPPAPTVRAPALDPTERRTVASVGETRCATSDPKKENKSPELCDPLLQLCYHLMLPICAKDFGVCSNTISRAGQPLTGNSEVISTQTIGKPLFHVDGYGPRPSRCYSLTDRGFSHYCGAGVTAFRCRCGAMPFLPLRKITPYNGQ
jgi:hypothetical protein